MTSDKLIGVSLKTAYYKQFLEDRPPIGWFEVHSENFFTEGGNGLANLMALSKLYPTSLHGIGLSLGSASGVQIEHLERLAKLVELVKPRFVSEHLSWGYINGVYMHDLLPIPYTDESLKIFSRNITVAQEFLHRQILIENPSSYLEYKASYKNEVDFLVEICKITDAKILLDVNNIFVSSSNHGWDAKNYIDAIPQGLVKEIHIAGHSTKILTTDQILRIDTHDNYVCDEVWDLYSYAIQRFGPTHTLLEWDANIPSLEVLIQEASKALVHLSAKSEAAYG
jgi:uncharacterized protein (UPF0276 family)